MCEIGNSGVVIHEKVAVALRASLSTDMQQQMCGRRSDIGRRGRGD